MLAPTSSDGVRLAVIGTGIKFGGHLTQEARGWIDHADVVIHAFADSVSKAWIEKNVPEARSVSFYRTGRPRRDTYDGWVDELLDPVRDGRRVCAVFYGHPGVYVYASHEAVRQARSEGYEAVMLPGISAEDCLIADLGVDPAHHGWVSCEATDFLLRRRPIDVHSALVLWQVGLTGRIDYEPGGVDAPGLPVLVEVLSEAYGPDHSAVVYEASQFAIFPPIIREVPVGDLHENMLTPFSTLYIPPLEAAPVDAERVRRLGLDPDEVRRTRNPLRKPTALS